MIKIVNRSNYDGHASYVGRPGPLGNPYSHVQSGMAEYMVGTRDEAVDMYEPWLKEKLKTDNDTSRAFGDLVEVYEAFGHLVLSCWCAPKRCHAEVIAKLIEEKVCAGETLQESKKQGEAVEGESCCEDVEEEDAGREGVVGCS